MQAELGIFSYLLKYLTGFYATYLKTKKPHTLERDRVLLIMYRGKGSNLHALSAPDPKSGVSTNSTTAAYLVLQKLIYFIYTIFSVNTFPPASNLYK